MAMNLTATKIFFIGEHTGKEMARNLRQRCPSKKEEGKRNADLLFLRKFVSAA